MDAIHLKQIWACMVLSLIMISCTKTPKPDVKLVDKGILLSHINPGSPIDVLFISDNADSNIYHLSEREMIIRDLECNLNYSIYYRKKATENYSFLISLAYRTNFCKENLSYQQLLSNRPQLNYLIQDFKQGSIYEIGRHGGLVNELDSVSGFIRGFDLTDSLLVWCSDSTEITIKNLETFSKRKVRFDSTLRIHHDMVLHYPYLSLLFTKKRYKKMESYQVIDEGIIKLDLRSGVQKIWSILDFLPNNLIPSEEVKGVYFTAHSNSIEVDEFHNYYISFRDLSQIWKISGSLDKVYYRIGKGTKEFNLKGELFRGQHSIDITAPNAFYLYDNGATGKEKELFNSRIVKVTVDSSMGYYKVREVLRLPDSLSTVRMGSVKGLGDRLVISVFNRFFNILEIDTLGAVSNHLINQNSYAIKVLPLKN
ncbi:MAG: aryl-sulfate sulfotransferase [Cyclobacteriaceae bacterium]